MAYKAKSPKTNTPGNAVNGSGQPETREPELVELLGKVAALLQESQPQKALKLVSHCKLKSPWVTNAMAVCLLRLQTPAEAANMLRGLVLASGGVTIRRDAPTVFTTNFATALLACGNVEGCLDALHDIRNEQDPVAAQLLAAVARWKKGLSLWQRLRWILGEQPDQPVAMDFPLGNLD